LITLARADTPTEDFQFLVSLLDEELRIRDGADHPFYAQFNTLEKISHYIVAYVEGIAVGCGSFRVYNEDTVEIKRMFVQSLHRGWGIASLILAALESWAAENRFSSCILETGYNQPEAIALYKKSGYTVIANYGPYENVQNSICMRKNLPGIFQHELP